MSAQKIVVCPQCLAKNRVMVEKLAANPQCGQCHTSLAALRPIELNVSNFSSFLSYSELPILVDLWAEWCGPCKMMAPQFAQAAQSYPQVVFGKIDTEAHPRISAAFNVRSIPTLVLLHQKQEIARVSGAMRASDIQQWLDQQLTQLSESV